MARSIDNGWDFIKVGETYQYKEDWFLAMVTVLEDLSSDKEYRFKLRIEKATHHPFFADNNFIAEISHNKEINGIYSGMVQLYENEAYMCNYKWNRENES